MFRLRRGFTHIYALLVGAILFVSSVSALRGDSVLNFPRLSFEPNTLTGIAIVNPSSQDATITITAYGTDGKPLSATGFTNPIQLQVRANQQISKLTSELFAGFLVDSTAGWFQATSAVDGLTGFFLFLNTSLTALDGADLPRGATNIIFNQVRVGSGYSTELNILNPGIGAASLTLQLVSSSSVSKPMTLPAKGVARLDTASFFGVTAVSAGAYVIASSDVDIAGFELVKPSTGDLLGLNARSSSERLTNLYFPQMAVLGSWKTELGLVNYSTTPAIVTVSAYKGDGTLYDTSNLKNNPVTRSLDAGASLREDVETMFGFTGDSTLDGWIKVESTASAINGYITYGLPSAGSVAAVASSPKGQTQAIFSHIATTAGFFTGVALLNPGTLSSNVRVLAIRPDGQVLGSIDFVLMPGQRTSKLINELIPQAGNQGGGLIWVKSDAPIYLTSLFGASSVLANIPAQDAPQSYRPDTALQTLKLTPSLAVVQPNSLQVFQVQGASGSVVWKVNGVAGGNATLGVVSSTGIFQAPNRVPSPQVVTITAEASNQIAGASVDVLEKTSLVTGLGIVQSVAYLGSLKKLYEAELATINTAKPTLPSSLAQTENSTIFEVSPTTKNLIAGFSNENISKIISFGASDGTEYLLLAAKTTGKVIRLNPTTKQTTDLITGLNQPTAMAIDSKSGNLLVVEVDKVSVVPKSVLEAGLSLKGPTQDPSTKAATLFSATGVAGIAVDNCTGDVYVSDITFGRIIQYVRATGATRVLISGLSAPSRLLAIYRNGFSCPESLQLLVVEQSANKLALVIPADGTATPWLPLSGVTDLALLPRTNTIPALTGTDGVLLSQVSGSTGEVAAVLTPDLYRTTAANPPDRGSCLAQIAFADPNLEAAVRSALKIDRTAPITCGMADSLVFLVATNSGIKSLSGLESFSKLQFLSLWGNSISDLTPLSAMGDLIVLQLGCVFCGGPLPVFGYGNSVRDLTPLTNLSNLRALRLMHNPVSDLRPLSALRNLVVIALQFASVGDITPIAGLKNLAVLNLHADPVSSIASVSGLTNLSYLNIQATLVTDIRPLAGLTKLEQLYADSNRFSDFTPLGNLINLTELGLGGTGMSDLRMLAGLAKMQMLFLSDNPINDISPLSSLTRLTDLSLFGCSISDIKPLVANQGLGAGAVIDLKNNNLTSANCPDLKALISRGATVFFSPQNTGALNCP